MERLRQRIAECGKTIDDDELVMHILYHLPMEYDNINDQYLKDLDDGKDVDLDDLRADLHRKYDRLLDSGRIEKIDDDGNDKMIKEEKTLKTGFKKQFTGKCHVCGKIGHKGTDCWTLESNKEKRPTVYNDKNDGNRNYKFNGNCNYCDKRATKKLTAGRNNVKTQIMWKKNTRYDDKQYKKTNVEEWIGDTGETCHMKSNTNGMYGLEKCKGI